jgi:hypothetical protein
VGGKADEYVDVFQAAGVAEDGPVLQASPLRLE